MLRLDGLHVQAQAGDDWTTMAAALGVTKAALADRNGATISGGTVTPAMKVGRVLHTPLSGG